MHAFESNSTFLQGLDSLDVCLGPAIGCRDCNAVSLSLFFPSFFEFRSGQSEDGVLPALFSQPLADVRCLGTPLKIRGTQIGRVDGP